MDTAKVAVRALPVAAAATTALGQTIDYVSPWLDVAESYIRNGEVTPLTWANAVSGTLGTAFSNNGIGQTPVFGVTTVKGDDGKLCKLFQEVT